MQVIFRFRVCVSGHHQQREVSTGKESSDPDITESLRSPRPQPAGEQLRPGQPVVVYQPCHHGDRIRGPGVLAAQPLRRQAENTHIAACTATDWKTHTHTHTHTPLSVSLSVHIQLHPPCPWTDNSWSLSSSTLVHVSRQSFSAWLRWENEVDL